MTYIFTKTDNLITISVDGNVYTDEYPDQYSFTVDSLNNIIVIKSADGAFRAQIQTTVDSVTINAEEFTGTAAELKTALLAGVFTNVSEGGAGGLDDVLAVGQVGTDNRTIDYSGYELSIIADNIYFSGGNLVVSLFQSTSNMLWRLEGVNFNIENEGQNLFKINTTPGGEYCRLRSRSSETGGETALLVESSSDNDWGWRLSSDDGVNPLISIIGTAKTGVTYLGTIDYTAVKHNFIGAVILPTSDPGVPGAIWNNAGTPAISA